MKPRWLRDVRKRQFALVPFGMNQIPYRVLYSEFSWAPSTPWCLSWSSRDPIRVRRLYLFQTGMSYIPAR